MRQPRRQRRFAAALVALALVAAGCTDAADDGALPAATPTSDTAPSAPTAATTTTAATTLAGDAAPAATAPGSAPQDDLETDPRDAYFALDRVLDISIEIDVEDWDTLRHQTRTLADVFAEIEEYGLSRPFASIYTWFGATVTVDGQTHADVGVRKKGFVGSQSSTKPSLKLRFDKYVDGQSLPGGMNRMTLNNSVQDPSMVNTCLSYRVFAAAGNPAPRCNFATVSVNGTDLGLYVHVEEFKAPFLSHHFENADGNLYEGTVSDFTLEFRGTFEKKTNEDADDWSDIDAVVAALSDPSDAGLTALGSIVDLDRFLSFWATEVLVGHWDGYAGDRNNYWFYRVPDGRFVFLPWGTDGTFHLSDDPNPFDNISDPPPSVLALTAIPNRLYNHPDWRVKYVARLKQILDDAWDETDLLSAVDAMAAIVQQHALPAEARAAEADTERVRTFIGKRRDEILTDLSPEPPEWPQPEVSAPSAADSGTLEITFETTWGSSSSPNPLGQGTVHSLLLNGAPESTERTGVFAGHANPEERVLLPSVDVPASIIVAGLGPDGSVNGMSLVVDPREIAAGRTLVIGVDAIAGGIWSIPPGASSPESFSPFTEGALELSSGGTTAGAVIAGAFSGAYGWSPPTSGDADTSAQGADTSETPLDVGLVINEVAAKGDPLDWFELHNASRVPIALDGFEMADDLTDVGKRVPFPAGTVIQPGAYMQFSLDKDGWPGFALGSDEELGIWLLDGTLVASVDWEDGQSGADQSYARVPDVTGGFATVDTPTPGAANQP
ncbi:CotH kinase family protein [Candidatus Poriferisodalis sp.]|uniref:CotH kinase family protein n=1 Tax=Candidatus Poriferisodalis sp. TaxID=3101277 RepID=UPI003B597374